MLKQLLSVFLQSPCLLCDRTSPTSVCQYCSTRLLEARFSQHGHLKLDRGLSVFAWGKYDGQLKRAIALMKYNNKPEIGTLLGKLLGQAWLNSDRVKRRQVTVVPIPLHHNKLKSRGFNQAEIIAKSFCQITGYSLDSQALIRTRETQAMFALNNLEEREKNLRGAFRIGIKLPRYPVLLVDDIYTTGSTIKESIRILQQHKIEVIGVAVIAKAGISE